MKKSIYLFMACILSMQLQAQTWTKLGLPETGKSVTDLYEDGSGNLFALTSQGLFKSTDKASNWTLVDRSMSGVEIMTVAPNGDIFVDENSAVIKYDGSKTSQVKWYRFATNHTTAAMVSLSDDKLIYTYVDALALKQKYYTSTDGGATFNEITTITNVLWKGLMQGQLMVKANDEVYYLGSDKNLYKSTDKGESYTAMGTEIEHTGRNNGICLDRETNAFYAVWGNGVAKNVYKSTDDGATWSKVTTSEVSGALNITASNDVVIIYGYYGFMYSDDGGATWVDKKDLFVSDNFPEQVLVASDGSVYATNMGDNAITAIDMSDDSQSLKTTGLDFTNAYGLSYNGTRLAACLGGYVHFTDDDGANWTRMKGDGAIAGNTYVSSTGVVYTASTKRGSWDGVYVQDGANDMIAVTADTKEVYNMQSMFEDDQGNIYCLSNLNGLYKSTNGTDFTQMPNAPFDNLNDMEMWFDEGSKRIYAIMPGAVHYSDDYGDSWTEGTLPAGIQNVPFKGEGGMWTFTNNGTATETGFYFSADLMNWEGPFKSDVPFDERWDQPVQGNKGGLYRAHRDNASTGGTVKVSTDKGETWGAYADGLETVLGFAINGEEDQGVPFNQIIASNDKLFLGTDGSIYMADQGTGVIGMAAPSQNKIHLYPNPAKDILLLDKDLVASNFQIYNQMGQVVLEGTISQNSINISNLPNGYYFIKIREQRGVSDTKFIINR